MLSSVDGQLLLIFALQIVALLTLARTLGYLVTRWGQPPVVGELAAGIVLGPSIFGALSPPAFEWLFPVDPVQESMLHVVAWLGAVLLLASAGTEIDLGRLRRLLRGNSLLPLMSVLLPLAGGLAIAWFLPAEFVGEDVDRALFAGFVAVSLTISGLPVVARILLDMGLLRRDLGQLILAVASFDDVVGWLLLGVLTRLAFDSEGWAALGVGALVAVVLLGLLLTVGQRLVDAVLRVSFRLTDGSSGPFTVTLIVILLGAALADLGGLDPLVGALAGGIVLGRSPMRRPMVRRSVTLVSTAALAPLFFATVGMELDLTSLGNVGTAAWALAVLMVACLTKIGGGWVAGRLGPVPVAVGTAVGIGLNARGGLSIVVAAIAASAGVFTDAALTTIVVVALATSVMAPPLLRRTLPRLPEDPEELDRLAQEALRRESQVASASRVLLPTRGGVNSRVAARVIDLVLDDEASVTVMSVADHGDVTAAGIVSAEVAELFGHRRIEQRSPDTRDPAAAILAEAARGYDLLVVGASQNVQHPSQLSDVLQRLLTESPVPVVLVRSRDDVEGLVFHRLLTPASGTRGGNVAEDLTYLLAVGSGAEVDVVHVIARSDRVLTGAWFGNADRQPAAEGLLSRSIGRARRFGMVASGLTRVGASAWEELLGAAVERGADVIVAATQTRDLGGRPFLGHGIEYLLEHAPQTLVIVAFPPDQRPEWEGAPELTLP